ncbi:hypothetical protein [Nocardia sp. NBC_01329]|uniref:hypothetical protein n=1 Tax=Nocardia sp. NBC_01329 TaxID=2903594 RepID=UPI002E0D7F2C|nr:hypothetical protein OG405_08000 [Nocardia sp. NBC_01329]
MSDTDQRDADVMWMRDDLRHACHLLGLDDRHGAWIACEFAPWAVGYLARRVNFELRLLETEAA